MADRTVISEPYTLGAPVPVRRISWGSIFAGFVVAGIVLVLLNLPLLGLGFNTIDPASDQNPLAGVGTGAIIGATIVNLIALFVGGYVACALRSFEAWLTGDKERVNRYRPRPGFKYPS